MSAEMRCRWRSVYGRNRIMYGGQGKPGLYTNGRQRKKMDKEEWRACERMHGGTIVAERGWSAMNLVISELNPSWQTYPQKLAMPRTAHRYATLSPAIQIKQMVLYST